MTGYRFAAGPLLWALMVGTQPATAFVPHIFRTCRDAAVRWRAEVFALPSTRAVSEAPSAPPRLVRSNATIVLPSSSSAVVAAAEAAAAAASASPSSSSAATSSSSPSSSSSSALAAAAAAAETAAAAVATSPSSSSSSSSSSSAVAAAAAAAEAAAASASPPPPPRPEKPTISSPYTSTRSTNVDSKVTGNRGVALMDSIIESRRIEDQEGFEVEYEYNGLKFAHYVGDRRADASSTDDIVLFLPGLDGSGCTLGPQVPDLVQKFDVWCLSVPPNDRSTFATVNRAVITHIETLHRQSGRRVLIVGESFGGMLALSVVLSLGADLAQKLIKGLLLVNPATGFERTLWQVIIPLFRNLPEPLYAVAVTPILVAVGPDVTQFRRVLQRVMRGAGPPWEQAAALKDTLEELVSLVKFLTDTIPMDTLQWRITRWLQTGVNRVNPRLKDVSVPVVVAAGTQDRVLPSVEEAARLKSDIPDCTTIRLQGSGHISLDGRVNLTDIITRSPKLLGPSRKTPVDPVKGWTPPSQAVVDRYTGIVDRWLERFTSPVFYSTDTNGNIMEGLSGVPTPTKENPVLLVGNHQLYGVDLGILVKTFIDDRGLFVRGLAHPALFQDTGREGLDDEIIFTEDEALFSAGFGVAAGMEAREMGSLRNVFQQFGAVPVSARNFYALLQKGEAVLLFPGGARETYHRKGEDYRLFWPDRSEFVRMASAFNATVVPFSAVGCADSFRFLLDSEELLRLPVVGRRVREMSDKIPNARGTGVPEDFIAPILFPLPPSRFYFVFGKPYSTGHVRKDKDAATKLYEDVKSEVSSGIDALLQARSGDVYRDFAPRFAYETATGKKAPGIAPHTLQRALDSARTANGLE